MNSQDYFIGRKEEIELIDLALKFDGTIKTKESQLIIVDGRRRVGKTRFNEYVINRYCQSVNAISLEFVGSNLVNGRQNILNAVESLNHQLEKYNQEYDWAIKKVVLKSMNWMSFFYALENVIEQIRKKNFDIFVSFDEAAWFNKRNEFIAQFSQFWNQFSGKQRFFCFVTSSVSYWLQYNIIQSKGGLFQRASIVIKLKPFTIQKIKQYILLNSKRVNDEDIAKYYLMFGGIIKYYQYLNFDWSFEENVEHIRKHFNSIYSKEDLFESLFGKDELYPLIVSVLCQKKHATVAEICESIQRALKPVSKYLNYKPESLSARIWKNLEMLLSCNIVSKLDDFTSKASIYFIADAFCYFSYFWLDRLNEFYPTSTFYSIWKGSALEIFAFSQREILNQHFHEDYQNFFLNWTSKGIMQLPKGQKNVQIDCFAIKDDRCAILECKMEESGYHFDLSEMMKLEYKEQVLKLFFEQKKGLPELHVQHWLILFNGFSNKHIKNELTNHKFFSLVDYVKSC